MSAIKLSSGYQAGLKALGIEPSAVLRHAGLPLALWNSGGLVTTEQFFAFWRAIGELADDPAIGLKLPLHIPVHQSHPSMIAASHARTFRDALQRKARYKSLCCSEEVTLAESRGQCRMEFKWVHSHEEPPSTLIDAAFRSSLELGRRGTRQRLRPVRVELRRPAAHARIYEAALECPVQFGAKRNAIVFHSRDLDLPFVEYNADLLEMLTPLLDHQLAQRRADRTLGDRVTWVLKRLLGGERPGLADVARELGTSARTLQRRLVAEGQTFRDLLNTARRELAHYYLKEPSLNVTEIAYLLSYEDPSSFFRAFQEWEGVTPSEWKMQAAHAH
jgi:AraC-like DNA-binding protein